MSNILVRVIPRNALKSGKLFGFRYRYWVEATISASLAGYYIFSTPLVMKIKIICACVICLSLFVFFMCGIKNRPVTQFFIDMISHGTSKAEYHLRSVSDEYKSKESNKFGGESILERTVNTVKHKAKKFDEKYGN